MLLLIILTLVACQEQSLNQQLKTINVSAVFNSPEIIYASNFVDEFEYIRLETSNETLYKYPENAKVSILQDSLILVKNFRVIALFDRITGEFIKNISHYGQAPNAYLSSSGIHQVNNTDTIIFARGPKGLVGYDIESGLKTIKLPFPKDSGNYQAAEIGNRVRLNDSIFVAYFRNGSGNQKLRLMTYSFDGRIEHFFPRKLFYENDPKFTFYSPNDVLFYKSNQKVFFKEAYNDTVFSITTSTLKPEFRFDLGSYAPDFKDQEYLARRGNKEKRDEYMFITRIIEIDDKLIFNIRFRREDFLGFYDQQTNLTKISNGTDDNLNGLVNDVDGFIPFSPSYLDGEGNVISTVPAHRVYDWFKNNRERIASLPDHIRKFKNIQPEDNPIIMIGRNN